MQVEAAIGEQIARLRETRQMSLTQLGQAIGRYLGKPWSRQAVHQAERGRRAFTAAELAAIALALDTSIPALFLADSGQIELPGQAVSAEDYRAILLYAGDDTPLDGVEELIVALHDIAEVLSRPALARLAKIGGVAEEVATAAPAAHSPDKTRGQDRLAIRRYVRCVVAGPAWEQYRPGSSSFTSRSFGTPRARSGSGGSSRVPSSPSRWPRRGPASACPARSP
jgi:transcriptional regulator with XRE-family HTH domain